MTHSPDTLPRLCDDLADEQGELDAMLSGLPASSFDTPTPAVGWDVRDQLIHLAFGEELAAIALASPDQFQKRLAAMADDPQAAVDRVHREARRHTPDDLLDWWRQRRADVITALAVVDPDARIPWAGPDMAPTTFARARLMETFAHGQDIRDAVGASRSIETRLFEVAHLGVRTRDFSYRLRGLVPPNTPVRVDLEAPDGSRRSWGPNDAPDRVTGPVLDFCLVVTRRRHPDDTTLDPSGPRAAEWLAIAQAYLGPPTGIRPPGAVTRVS